jgi:prepilin-type processing-associated H-X9-DG protein
MLAVVGRLVLVSGLCVVLLAFLFPIFAKERHVNRPVSCASNLKQIGLALQMYAEDYEGRLPDATTFMTAIMPYLRNERCFHCPEDGTGTVSYSMAASLSLATLPADASAARRVLVYEGSQGTVELRHNRTANYCFADGHVKAMQELPPNEGFPDLVRAVEVGSRRTRRGW